jgi:hypothetical protein
MIAKPIIRGPIISNKTKVVVPKKAIHPYSK